MKLFLGMSGLRVVGRASALRPFVFRTPRRRMAMVTAPKLLRWLWLLAMLFCQAASALNACGTMGAAVADGGAAQVAPMLPCHDAEEPTTDCGVADCLVGQGLTDLSGTPFASLPVEPEQFECIFAQRDERLAPMTAHARAPGYPPPHVLGRLLI